MSKTKKKTSGPALNGAISQGKGQNNTEAKQTTRTGVTPKGPIKSLRGAKPKTSGNQKTQLKYHAMWMHFDSLLQNVMAKEMIQINARITKAISEYFNKQ